VSLIVDIDVVMTWLVIFTCSFPFIPQCHKILVRIRTLDSAGRMAKEILIRLYCCITRDEIITTKNPIVWQSKYELFKSEVCIAGSKYSLLVFKDTFPEFIVSIKLTMVIFVFHYYYFESKKIGSFHLSQLLVSKMKCFALRKVEI